VAFSVPLSAQFVLKGTLYHDVTGAPVRGTVMLIDPSTDAPVAHVVTDSSGQFVLKVSAGTYQIAAVRDGFSSTLSSPVAFQNGERLTIRIPLAVDGDPKHPIGVIEHAQLDELGGGGGGGGVRSGGAEVSDAGRQEYDARQSMHGPGLRYTRADLARSSYGTLGEFLERIPGLSMSDPSSAGSVQMSRSMTAAGGALPAIGSSCHVGWFIDGHRMDYGTTIDPSTDAIGRMQLESINAVEVFRGLSEMPTELASPDLQCGAVAIWTRRE
jgi:hypothetical protein